MAILFFDGFDRCTITKQLDRNYWSFQPQVPVEYEKYAFGGYSYDHTQAAYNTYNGYYAAYSPNNGHLPISKTQGTNNNLNAAGTQHPAFGSPLGFLALNNLDISDSSMLAPLTYLQVSGFSLPQSGESFLNFRIHGIETKDSNYHSSDAAGRFGAKHPLVAFCSGNTTGLIFNIVKVTGNQLETVENTKMTIGLEVEQLAGASGSFDLNIGNDLQNYRIRSLYSDGSASYHSGTAQPADLSDLEGRILMPVTDRNTTSPYIPQTRWCHFTLGIIQTGVTPEIKVKLDDIDLLTIPTDDTITDKDLWDSKIGISGFNYDNIRFFNRTYNASIPMVSTWYVGYPWSRYYSATETVESNYYERGANTLLDDIILNDGSGTANTFLGKTAKVIPFTPGVNSDVTDGGVVPDPYREWTTNTTSHRLALKNLDGDNGKISSPTVGKMTAIPYRGSGNITLPDTLSLWRMETQDAIGGMKIYTVAKKEFLDSAFVPVLKTGEVDKDFGSKTSILIRPSGGLVDALNKETISFHPAEPIPSLTSISKFGSGVNMHGSHLVVPFIESLDDLYQSSAYNNSHLYQNNATLFNDGRFVIESWVYFTGSEPIDLYRTNPPTGYEHGVPTRSNTFNISCDPEGITYSATAKGDSMNHVHTQNVKLLFNQTAATGQWHHVAFVQDYIDGSDNDAWPIYSFLNGTRNSQHVVSIPSGMNYDLGLHNTYNFYYDIFPSASNSGLADGNSSQTIPSGDFNIDKNMLLSLSSPSGALVGSGTLNNPATGVLTIQNTTEIVNQDIVSFTVDDTGFLVLNMDAALVTGGYHQFEIHRNNVKQLTFNGVFGTLEPTQNGIYQEWAQIYVNSGDSVGIRPVNDFTISSPSTVNIKQLYVTSPTGNGTFYQRQTSTGYKNGAFGVYINRYKTDGGNFNDSKIFPTFIGGNNIMGQYRLTQGSATNENDIITTRYRDDFSVPSTGFLIDKESYIDLGENISLTKTRYGKAREFFVFENPITNQPWTTGLIADPSGLILGVRKT